MQYQLQYIFFDKKSTIQGVIKINITVCCAIYTNDNNKHY